MLVAEGFVTCLWLQVELPSVPVSDLFRRGDKAHGVTRRYRTLWATGEMYEAGRLVSSLKSYICLDNKGKLFYFNLV
jgi:hypothetical protein